jgi:hypothetical protein
MNEKHFRQQINGLLAIIFYLIIIIFGYMMQLNYLRDSYIENILQIYDNQRILQTDLKNQSTINSLELNATKLLTKRILQHTDILNFIIKNNERKINE